jgi:RimJ/RimL family protein N-acetyltransferase
MKMGVASRRVAKKPAFTPEGWLRRHRYGDGLTHHKLLGGGLADDPAREPG